MTSRNPHEQSRTGPPLRPAPAQAQITRSGDHVLVSLADRALDALVEPYLHDLFDDLLGDDIDTLTIDLAMVEFCGAAGARILARASRQANAHRITLHVINIHAHVQWVLDITGTAALLDDHR